MLNSLWRIEVISSRERVTSSLAVWRTMLLSPMIFTMPVSVREHGAPMRRGMGERNAGREQEGIDPAPIGDAQIDGGNSLRRG